jgi:hypothetical protein
VYHDGRGSEPMSSAGKTLPTSINARYREQYEDAVSVHLRAQETAGLDICTDGDAHYDEEVGGMSWQSYPLQHLGGEGTVEGGGRNSTKWTGGVPMS